MVLGLDGPIPIDSVRGDISRRLRTVAHLTDARATARRTSFGAESRRESDIIASAGRLSLGAASPIAPAGGGHVLAASADTADGDSYGDELMCLSCHNELASALSGGAQLCAPCLPGGGGGGGPGRDLASLLPLEAGSKAPSQRPGTGEWAQSSPRALWTYVTDLSVEPEGKIHRVDPKCAS